MRHASWKLAALASAAGLASLPAAHASSNYPAEIQTQLSLSYVPACAICHANGVTGLGTVTTPFGLAMRGKGLVSRDIPSLDTALAALEAEMSPYITDLQKNVDPNDPRESASSPLTYGCLNVTGQGPAEAPAGVLLLGLAVLHFVRARSNRRAVRRPSGPSRLL